MTLNPKQLLSSSAVFNSFQSLVGMPDLFHEFFRNHVKPRPGDKMLDLGCGVGATLRHVPDGVRYTGVDISAEYIAAARAKFGQRGIFITSDVAEAAFDGSHFDCAIAVGVIHHLDDTTAAALLRLASTSLRPGGCLYTIDPCYVPEQSWIGKWITGNDRGQFVRSPAGYRALFNRQGRAEGKTVRGLLRVPYTHFVAKVSFTASGA